MQILLQTTPDSLTSFILCFSLLLGNSADTFTEIYKHTYIYINICSARIRTAFGPSNLLTSLREEKVLKWSMLNLAIRWMQREFEHLNLAPDLESSGNVQGG